MNTKLTTLILAASLLTGFAAAQTQQQQQQTDSQNYGPSTNVEALLISSDPVPVQSDEQADLNFKLRNTGDSTAEDVEIELLDNYPFEVLPDRQKNYSLGDLATGQEYQISTEVRVAEDAPDGSNDFKVRIHYGDFTATKNIPVEVQSEDIDLNLANLQTQPGQLMPDTDDNTMTVEVVNNGEKTAENTVLDLDLPDYFERTSSFSSRQALGNIQPGQVKPAEFTFDLSEDGPSGLTTVNGEISYTPGDSSSEVTQDVSYQVNIEGRPQFEIVNVESGLQTGSSGEIRLEVQNTGNEESSSTRIRVLDSSDQPFTYDSSSQYVGTLDPNQTGEAVFEVETDSGATAKDYLIDFETRGVKGTEVFVEDTTVEASVTNGESGSSPVIPVAIVLLLATIGIYFRDKIFSKVRED